MVKIPRARAGYTLAEVMVVVAILGILSNVGARLFLNTNRFFIMTNAKTELQTQARGIMYIVGRNLHQAQSATIVIDRLNSSQPFYSRISFQKIQGGSTVSYYQQGTNFVQAIGTNITVLSKDIQYLSFTFPRSDDMTIVSVSMTLQKSIYQGQTKALHMASERVQVMN